MNSSCFSSSDELVPAASPPNITAELLEIWVNEKEAIGGGMSPMTVGMVHSATLYLIRLLHFI